MSQDNSDRPFFRIIRCCGNCFFGFYYKGNQRRMGCWLKDGERKKKKGYYKKETLKKLPKVHVTTVCDEHQFKSKAMSLDAVTDYCGAEYLGD